MAAIDKDAISQSYLDVRDDKSETNWAVYKYSDKTIVHAASGTDYQEFRSHFTEGERVYGFVRIETGDELSKRAKFAFITWIGEGVGALQKAKVSTDKASVKQVVQAFAVEILANDPEELDFDHVKSVLVKAGGANYGTGK
ncbi:coactosin-like protein [Pocillopora verrucosa]|uniref:coactosin-like protein n=1 Tax=Pocillopora verrucosa TaxID=203993 RepID=UPI00279740A8|nr:coactosin-like protein [Pocillopora verrucosa]